jgi:UPF0271 protein
MNIDLNADIGEGFLDDAEILESITSANVSCGYHAGDAPLIYRTIRLAIERGVSVGAHPSLRDRERFGRVAFEITPEDLLADLLYQIGAVQAIANSLGGRVSHVKPHGALYHIAETDVSVAETICDSVSHFGTDIALFALSMGNLAAVAQSRGIRVAHEVFADRMVEADGNLTPRSEPGAVLHDPDVVTARIIKLVREGTVIARNGAELRLKADTVCFHGDTPGSADFARQVKASLIAAGIKVSAF